MQRAVRLLFLLLSPALCVAQTDRYATLRGEYLGQKKPGMTPEIFAAGLVSTGFSERDMAISPDGTELFFGLITGRQATIMHSRQVAGRWTEPEIAPFASDERFFHLEPSFAADGKRIYFLSTRPPQGKDPKPRWGHQNIWMAERNADGTWGTPLNPDTVVINSGGQQYYPSFARNEVMYFTRVDSQTSKPAIYRSRPSNGRFGAAERLPAIVNQPGTSVFNASIAPDESYLIACVEGRPNDINPGLATYYVFFRDREDHWSDGVALGPDINASGSAASSASVSPDGRYLFFAAQKMARRFADSSAYRSISKIIELSGSPQNGNSDIYWVDARVIEALRPK